MIHVVTIHYRTADWIELQLDHLSRHTAEPYRTYASLDGIGDGHDSRFDRVVTLGEVHPAAKLDALGAMALAEADPDDLIVFIHGDCFPIREWTAPVRELLAASSLVAVRRSEHFAEPIPHPSFTVTTAGLWRQIGGSWATGPKWTTADGIRVTDAGAVLFEQLEANGVPWQPLLRTNAVDLHPLFFAIYGDLVYHHGAAFRRPISRADAASSISWPRVLRYPWLRAIGLRNTRRSHAVYRGLVNGDQAIDRLRGTA